MKYILLSLIILNGFLFADIKKPLDIDEFTKEIEKIQSVTKQNDNSQEITNSINKKQNESTLIELESRELKPETSLIDVDLISSKVKSEIERLEDDIARDTFIPSSKGFNIGNVKYKKVLVDDVNEAFEKIVEKRKKLNTYRKTLLVLNDFKNKDKKIFYNRDLEQLLTEIKNEEKQNINTNEFVIQQQNTLNNQKEKIYVDVKIGDIVAGAKVVNVTDFGINIK